MLDEIYNIANYLHLLASIALLMKIWTTTNCAGISGKSQLLYMLVYTTRYSDLFTVYISDENTLLKIIYLTLGYCTVLSIFLICKKSYEKQHDTFRIELLLTPCLILAIYINHDTNVIEILWAFSIYLEAVAMVPQFQFIAKANHIHKHMFYYLLALGSYKGLYIVHWIYRYYHQHWYDGLANASGIIQVLLYLDFFLRILPKLESKDPAVDGETGENSTDGPVDENTVENGDGVKSGHLAGNISTIILTPASLIVSGNDKENLLKGEEHFAKSECN